jgi:predicted urease superfamily metal-dependent hydrolase
VAALVAAVALAGCGGGDDDSEYKDTVRTVNRELVALSEDVGQAIETAGGSTDEELADEFARFAREAGGIRVKLAELVPPDDLAEEQEDLEEAIGAVRVSLEDIAAAARESDPDAARVATQELVQRLADLDRARRALTP